MPYEWTNWFEYVFFRSRRVCWVDSELYIVLDLDIHTWSVTAKTKQSRRYKKKTTDQILPMIKSGNKRDLFYQWFDSAMRFISPFTIFTYNFSVTAKIVANNSALPLFCIFTHSTPIKTNYSWSKRIHLIAGSKTKTVYERNGETYSEREREMREKW